jgi:hypothetical protein
MSKHFSIQELTFSQAAARNGINNTPSPEIAKNLEKLCESLEQIRALVGSPIAISSGYRSPELNKIIGGAKDSAHTKGLAADISTNVLTPKALALLIKSSDIKYDQLIYEGTWVHFAIDKDGAGRRQNLTAKFNFGKASYTEGIV